MWPAPQEHRHVLVAPGPGLDAEDPGRPQRASLPPHPASLHPPGLDSCYTQESQRCNRGAGTSVPKVCQGRRSAGLPGRPGGERPRGPAAPASVGAGGCPETAPFGASPKSCPMNWRLPDVTRVAALTRAQSQSKDGKGQASLGAQPGAIKSRLPPLGCTEHSDTTINSSTTRSAPARAPLPLTCRVPASEARGAGGLACVRQSPGLRAQTTRHPGRLPGTGDHRTRDPGRAPASEQKPQTGAPGDDQGSVRDTGAGGGF